MEQDVGGIAQCDHENNRLKALAVIKKRFSREMSVSLVANKYRRTMYVVKDSHSGIIPAKSESAAFDGALPEGVWQLFLPLQPGESCDAARRSVRQQLSVRLTYSCSAQ